MVGKAREHHAEIVVGTQCFRADIGNESLAPDLMLLRWRLAAMREDRVRFSA